MPSPHNTSTPSSTIQVGEFPIEEKPISVPPPKAVKSLLRGDCERYRTLFESYDWNASTAMAICDMESGGSVTIVNNNPSSGDFSVGLMQINLYGEMKKSRPSEEDLKDPKKNIAFAYELYKKEGFHPWTTYKKIKNN